MNIKCKWLWQAMAVLGCLLCIPDVWAQQVQVSSFEARITANDVFVGDPFSLTLEVVYQGAELSDVPSQPDLGNLTVRSGPSVGSQTIITNGRVRVTRSWSWDLIAPQEGNYVIGTSVLKVGGKELRTKPIRLQATKRVAKQIPQALKDASIIPARTSDPQLNQVLEGRLFVRRKLSNPRPYLREPVIVSYELYRSEIPFSDARYGMSEVPDTIREDLFSAQGITEEEVEIDGKTYQVAPLYTTALIPVQQKKITAPGYTMAGVIPQRRQASNPFSFDFDMFNRGFQVELPTEPIVLDVQPLPAEGVPPGFRGTVGDFKLRSEVDTQQLTTNDLVTCKLILEGKGAISLAELPDLPEFKDFVVVDQSDYEEQDKGQDELGGRMVVEVLLRPKRAGELTIPAAEYALFDPYAGVYRVEKTEPITIAVALGKQSGIGMQLGGNEKNVLEISTAESLRYLKPIAVLHNQSRSLLLSDLIFWLPQLAALLLFVTTGWKIWKRGRLDPTAERMTKAQRNFEKRLRAAVRHADSEGDDAQEAAGGVEQAIRQGIADHLGQPGAGMAWQEIEQELLERALPPETLEALGALVDRLAACRYAPAAATTPEVVRESAREARKLMKEVFAR